MKINEQIKTYRLGRGLSQEQLGNELGVSHAAISDMERGITSHIPTKLIEGMLRLDVISGNPKSILAKDITVQELIDTVFSIQTKVGDIWNLLNPNKPAQENYNEPLKELEGKPPYEDDGKENRFL